jgi:ERCC4-related helicase
MFKKPVEVKIDTQISDINHRVSQNVFDNMNDMLLQSEDSVKRVIVFGAVAATASQILVHVAKTYIK